MQEAMKKAASGENYDERHIADAAVINDMLKVEKSLKEFERKTDRAEEELHQLYKHVEESLEHEFLADELDKLNKLEEDFNH
uniref:Tropomyosin n=1 Tax=Ditylenchus dipsaci TaxID=166011 RepID=A0A915CQC6_9BILA